MIQFFTRDNLITCIKCFLEINENSTNVMTCIQWETNMFSGANQGVVCGIITTKTKLFIVNRFGYQGRNK